MASIRERADRGRHPARGADKHGADKHGAGEHGAGEAKRGPVRAPLRPKSRRRWAVAGGVALCWLVAEVMTGSVAAATVVLVALAALGVVLAALLRALGVTRDHPWFKRAAARPWRDGQDVLNVAVRHLSEVLIVTPSGSLIAPDVVEMQLSPEDLASLRDWMDLDVVATSVTEAYQDQVAKRGARFAGRCQPEVYLVPDVSVPQGRYRLRRGLPAGSRPPAGVPTTADPVAAHLGARAPHDARTLHGADLGRTVMDGKATVLEQQVRPAVPVLRLVTGSSVAETTTSGARAGRGPVELELPDVPTVSRVHAVFTFAERRWWVTNQGVNGLYLNGVEAEGQQVLLDGDTIRWGKNADAPQSRVHIG